MGPIAAHHGERLDMEAVVDNVLEIEDLRVSFYTEEGELRAVDGVSFSIPRGSIVGLVGESGCGKSVTSYSVLRLIQSPGKIKSGSIRFNPKGGAPVEITARYEQDEALYYLRGGAISMIFQEPMTALSPVHTIGDQICEAIMLHADTREEQAAEIAGEMLDKVGIPNPQSRLGQYPFEMSGGMRQRVVIAMALACAPEVLIADEPTTALDVTIQAQIIRLIKSLQRDLATSTLLITHDLGVVAQLVDYIAVMYLGRIVEQGDVRAVMKDPRHPYTMGLLESLPSLAQGKERLSSIEGNVPGLAERPPGCPFHPRCAHVEPGVCDRGDPPLLHPIGEGRMAACVRLEEIHGGDVE